MIDFDSSRHFEKGEEAKGTIGTPEYMAPELVDRQKVCKIRNDFALLNMAYLIIKFHYLKMLQKFRAVIHFPSIGGQLE